MQKQRFFIAVTALAMIYFAITLLQTKYPVLIKRNKSLRRLESESGRKLWLTASKQSYILQNQSESDRNIRLVADNQPDLIKLYRSETDRNIGLMFNNESQTLTQNQSQSDRNIRLVADEEPDLISQPLSESKRNTRKSRTESESGTVGQNISKYMLPMDHKSDSNQQGYQLEEIRIYRKNGWFIHELDDNVHLYARKAYMDTRQNDRHAWFIRIYAIFHGYPVMDKDYLWCRPILKADANMSSYMSPVKARVYERSMKSITVQGRGIHRILITCEIRPTIDIEYISLLINKEFSNAQNMTGQIMPTTPSNQQHDDECIPVTRMIAEKNFPIEFGICVPLSYGNFDDADAVRLVEWVELNKLFGIGEINIHNVSMNMSRKFESVLNHYVTEKIVRLHQYPPPVDNDTASYNVSKMSDLVVLNECMMDNMYRYKYMMIIDFDEFIVPRQGNISLSETFNSAPVYRSNLASTHPIVSYLVHFVQFYLDLPSDPAQPSYLSTMKHTLKWGHATETANTKQITNPRLCTHVYMHYCDLAYLPNHPQTPTFNKGYIKASSLLVHHYRKSCKAMWQKDVKREKHRLTAQCGRVDKAVKKSADKMRDDYMIRFREQLDAQVYPVLDKFSLLEVEIS